jgi:hypothetical protein
VARVDALTRQIHLDAGKEFNVNSTPQLRAVLFDRLDGHVFEVYIEQLECRGITRRNPKFDVVHQAF